MLNAEKFKKEIESFDYMFAVVENKVVSCANLDTCENCEFKARCGGGKIKWLLEEYKEPILNEEGKEFLKQLIAPFKSNEIVSVCKNEDLQILRIDYKIGWTCYSKKVLGEKWDWFKNLNPEKLYTLEELGLRERLKGE